MRKFLTVLTLLAALAMTSCAAGPKYLGRSVDDLDRKVYVNNPIVDGILWVVPVFPAAHFFAAIGDFFINGYSFWVKDVWSGEGTGFQHADIPQQKYIKSLVIDDAEFFNFEGEGY